MALQYINSIAPKASRWRPGNRAPSPVLTEDDEAFLQQVTSSQNGKDPQIALMDGAQDIPLPLSPMEDLEQEMPADAVAEKKQGQQTPERTQTPTQSFQSPTSSTSPTSPTSPSSSKSRRWSWMKRSSISIKKGSIHEEKNGNPSTSEIATKPPSAGGEQVGEQERKEEKDDLAVILERLNLAAENNRVFSISSETQRLLHKFMLIFRDLVTGIPTAYHDLELLLSNGDKQLRETFGHLPGFLQKLIEQLPDRITESLAPELLAAAGEKASQSGFNTENAGKAAAAAAKMGLKTPSLKELVGKPAALVGMLRSIVAFLRARFPAVLCMNVLWSVAVFVVLLVLWYCHKRGREVRLENERLVTDAEVAQLNETYNQQIRETETLSTVAPPGASVQEVRDGIERVQQARESASQADEDHRTTNPDHPASAAAARDPATANDPGRIGAAASGAPSATARNGKSADRGTRRWSTVNPFSLFRSQSRKENSLSNVTPYPGT